MPPSDPSRAPRWTEITAVAGAMVAAGIATVAVVGWNIGVEPLIAVQAGYIPLQYNTALGLLGCALSLLALLRGRRWLSTAAAGAVTLLSSAMAVEYIGEMDVGIDTLFFNRIVADHISGRMAPNTVAAFLCVSLALLLLTWQHRIRGASGLAVSLAAFVAAVGSVGLTGYLAKIPSAYQWRAQTPIAVLTTLGFLALAAATIAAAWDSRRDRSSALPSWLPAPAFVFLMSVCGMIARATWATSRMPVLPQARRSLVFSTVQMLLFGAAVSVALAGVIRMAQAAQRRSRELSLLNAALDVEVERRCREQAVTEGLNRALRLICACNHAIAHAEDEPELLRRICELAVEIGGYPLAWIGFAEDEGERLVRAVAKAGPAADYIQDGSVTWAEDARGRGPTGAAIRTGRVCRCDSMLIDSDFRPWRDRAQEFGFRSSLAVPLLQGGAAFGALSIYACVTDAFAEAELELFTQLGNDLAFGIDALRTRAARDRAERELRQASLYARSLLEASLDPLVTISREGKITDVNAATEAVTGAPRNALIGTDFSTYFTEPERASAAYQRVFAEGMVKDYPLAMRDGQGRTIDVLYNASLYRNQAGEVEGVFAAARDVTERKRSQQELERFAQELKRSNDELQEFAFVASHDLQEPLRKITAFAERLVERCGPRLDEVGLDYLSRMHKAALRMGTLIESLLDYSRLETRAVPFQRVDLAATMLGVLSDLEERIRETCARITVAALPIVAGDPVQLRQLLQNLLSNALKFHSPGQTPSIQVRARRQEGRWEVSVADSGIGFDPAFTDKIFRPFQRLHGRAEYEGSGMGLAICRKIAQRHGASISVTSQPGQGATFRVSLPAIPERTDPCPEPQSESCSPKTMTTITC